jgi:hypothetical protein
VDRAALVLPEAGKQQVPGADRVVEGTDSFERLHGIGVSVLNNMRYKEKRQVKRSG